MDLQLMDTTVFKLRAVACRVANDAPFNDRCLALSLAEFSTLTAERLVEVMNEAVAGRGFFQPVERCRFVRPAEGEAFHLGFYSRPSRPCRLLMVGYQPQTMRYDCRTPATV